MTVYALICNGELDQICYSKREANKEKKDLKNMGFFNLKIKEFPSEADAYDWNYKVNRDILR